MSNGCDFFTGESVRKKSHTFEIHNLSQASFEEGGSTKKRKHSNNGNWPDIFEDDMCGHAF